MFMFRKSSSVSGFALPTVLISSVILFTILVSAAVASASVRTGLKEQYYSQIAREAGESGLARAKECISQGVITWTELTPSTDCSGVPYQAPVLKVLVVGGGGGGGLNGGGGGGGGGVTKSASYAPSVGSVSVTVGSGGNGAVSQFVAGSNGGNSVFGGLTAIGGGGGASRDGGPAGQVGGAGGGGAGGSGSPMYLAGSGTAGQGFAGGNGTTPDPGCDASGGGGGGAGGPGFPGTFAVGGAGGEGVVNSFSGINTTYGGGGGGAPVCPSGRTYGNGGAGGGGYWNGYGANYLGGGGSASASGGIGIVIVSYPYGSITATGGAITTVGGNTIHKFIANGTFTVSAINPLGCPTDPRCFVISSSLLRTSYSVPPPSPMSGGTFDVKATGTTSLLRSSTNTVWRKYSQSVRDSNISAENNGNVVVSKFAGSAYGYSDGTGPAASFTGPRGIAVDSAGTLYVADSGNNRIRKITTAGVVTTLAGSGAAGFANGTGVAAVFNGPADLAVDVSGNVYVADTQNDRVRKITPAGIVTTLAGSGTDGYADGNSAAARFGGITGITVDSYGNVYVADSSNNRIRKIFPTGVVSTVAGSGVAGYAEGSGATAVFNSPNDVTVDSSGNLYVSDTGNNRIRRISPTGTVTTLAGSGIAGTSDGVGTAANFNTPAGIAVSPTGIVFVNDLATHRIRKITPSGVVSTYAGSGAIGHDDGRGQYASFQFNEGMALDASGNLYVTDYGNVAGSVYIRKIVQNNSTAY